MVAILTETLICNYQKLLFPYAYNLLGSADDAMDAIQDVMANYLTTASAHVEDEKNYLIRSVINRAINIRNRRKKVRYTDGWLPEPVSTERVETNMELKEVLSYSLMILLEKLNARERAVFILREGFHYSHEEIASLLSTTVENSRKLLSRAKTKVKPGEQQSTQRTTFNPDIMNSYILAIRARNMEKLESLLANEIAFFADGGPNLNVVAKTLSGIQPVSDLLLYIYDKYQTNFSVVSAEVNHQSAVLFYSGQRLISCQVFELLDDGKISRINTIVDPEKLKNLEKTLS